MKSGLLAGLAALMMLGATPMPAEAQVEFYSYGNANAYGHVNAYGNINARQNQIRAQINAGLRSGRLTRGEAFTLRSRLNSIEALEANMRMDGLNRAERMQLIAQLNSAQTDLRNSMRNIAYGRGRHLGWFLGRGGNRVYFDDLSDADIMRADLEARIQAGIASGALTLAEAHMLRARLDLIEAEQERLALGGVTNYELRSLFRDLTRLANDLVLDLGDRVGRRVAVRHWWDVY